MVLTQTQKLVITSLFLFLTVLVAFLIIYSIQYNCICYNTELFDTTSQVNTLAVKYFGDVYAKSTDCTGERLTPTIKPSTGNLPKFLLMAGKVYKLGGTFYDSERPGYEEYVMFDKFDLNTNKVKFFKSSTELATGIKKVTMRCIDIDANDLTKLTDVNGTLTVYYVPIYDTFNISENKSKQWALTEIAV